MTNEQVDLEFEHMMIDKAEKDGNTEVFADDDYDNWEDETEGTDSRLSDMPEFGSEESDPHKGLEKQKQLPKPEKQFKEDEWEEVE